MKSIRVAVAAAAAGVSFLGLTACSSPVEAGAAAVVGDQRISSRELAENVREFEAALKKANIEPEQLGVPITQFVLFRMTNQLRYQQVADKHGVTVSETEVDTALKDPGQYQDPQMNLLSKGVSPADARDYVRAEVGATKVIDKFGGRENQQAAMKWQEEYNAVKTVFSPRYGTFQPDRGFVDPGRFGKPVQAEQEQQG
ncbi:SurA N-terminal domain-containing protein [Nonomuraea sp. MCN248]|uniref:SurA N-terminal domain-containing protein n=1 Tax=Nonomuraea corallina TaxID=2989783 RepID=A0ABT4SB90_9ACTN|nr:SurA N-terminal domain-containing protein [Nonomuraea corallina]MDA0634476.1 SurA N-terminal domain-containing protein [Nonomuraea corallina]